MTRRALAEEFQLCERQATSAGDWFQQNEFGATERVPVVPINFLTSVGLKALKLSICRTLEIVEKPTPRYIVIPNARQLDAINALHYARLIALPAAIGSNSTWLDSLDTLVSTCSTGSTGSTKSNVSSRVEPSGI